MSNPLINRWGFNLFWYHFWYTDKNNFLQNTLDIIISKLLLCYVTYGLLLHKNVFFSSYWYKKSNYIETNLFKIFDKKYFRTMSHKNRITGEISLFYTRLKRKDVYFSKLWLLRYQGWIIVNISAFQPVKKKHRKKKTRNFFSSFLINSNNIVKKQLSLIFKYNLYLSFIKKNYLIKKNLYYFF